MSTHPARTHRGGATLESDEISTLIGEGTKTLARTLGKLTRPLRQRLLKEGDGAYIVIEAALHPTVLASAIKQSPLLPALLRGVKQRRTLLQAGGGSLSGDEIAAALGISRRAVDKLRRQGRLLAVRDGGTWRYPAWQIADGDLLPGLTRILRALHEQSPWTIMAFLLSRSMRLGSRRPLDLLRRGRVEPVLKAAESYGEHGAT
jgi:helix-turn-helix protein